MEKDFYKIHDLSDAWIHPHFTIFNRAFHCRYPPWLTWRGPTNLYQFRVVYLDRNTCKTLWQTQVKEALPHEDHHGDTGYASYSPVTDGKHVWAS